MAASVDLPVTAAESGAPASDADDLIVVVYTSAASRDLSRAELAAMLQGARRRNGARGVTGLLLYHDSVFMQAIEGSRVVVEGLLATISLDPRHRGVMVLLQERRAARLFPDHSMAYRDMSAEVLPEGYRGLLNDGLRGESFHGHPDRVYRLLQTCADTLLRRRQNVRGR